LVTDIKWCNQSYKNRYFTMGNGTTNGWCCNLSGGVALNVWFTTNGMCAKNNNTYTWHEQAIIELSWRGSSADTNLWTMELDD